MNLSKLITNSDVTNNIFRFAGPDDSKKLLQVSRNFYVNLRNSYGAPNPTSLGLKVYNPNKEEWKKNKHWFMNSSEIDVNIYRIRVTTVNGQALTSKADIVKWQKMVSVTQNVCL